MKFRYWLFALTLIGLCGCKSRVERAYDACVAKMKAESEKMIQTQPNGEAEKALSDAAVALSAGLGIAVCDAMKEACKADPEGAMCKASIAQF
jgi:hypothetical protein